MRFAAGWIFGGHFIKVRNEIPRDESMIYWNHLEFLPGPEKDFSIKIFIRIT